MHGFRFNLYAKRSKMLSTGILAFIIGSAIGVALFSMGGVYIEPVLTNLGPLQRFSSYDELKAFLNTSSQSPPWGGYYRNQITFSMEASDSTKTPAPLDYSTTNIQVAGVDEIDIVKTDGQFIYVVSGSSMFIVQAYPAEEAAVLSQIDLKKVINGLYVNDDKLVLLTGGFSPHRIGFIVEGDFYDSSSTEIKVYDIADRAAPTLDRNVTVEGSYFNSRMISDHVYIIITQPACIREGEVALPVITEDGQVVRVPATSIYYSNVSDYYYAFTNILAINTQNPEEEITRETVLTGSASNLYVSQTNIYIASFGFEEMTKIHKISVKDGAISYVATGNITGYVLDQFSMDEYKDYFRVATTVHAFRPQTHLYVLNSSLHVVGKIEGIAPGEDLHSARFMADNCYLVTFKKVDPLFAIDLKDQENPQILGKLKIPGYSDYLHPFDDEHLLGIGKETVESEVGDFAWYQGVKVSLFDVSNVSKPTELNMTAIGDRGTDSPALRDHKALLFSRDKKLLVIPILLAEIDKTQYPSGVPPSAYGNYVWQGAYVLDVSLEQGIRIKGTISHMGDDIDLLRSGDYFESSYAVKRALYIENVLYTISDKKIKMNSLEDLLEVNEIELA